MKNISWENSAYNQGSDYAQSPAVREKEAPLPPRTYFSEPTSFRRFSTSYLM